MINLDSSPQRDPVQKALFINLDNERYGTLAEIGAGQEVASRLFHAGAASGTVAKSMSAYDMTVSDTIYGKSNRYVSKSRLCAMLEHEYTLLIERLSNKRGDSTCFFAFADTVSARNYSGTNECHGWMGIRFQNKPHDDFNEILIHIHMNDKEALHQYEALGTLGINLLYAAFYQSSSISTLTSGLADGIEKNRIEIDYIELAGPAFSHHDKRLANIALLRNGLTHAILFNTEETPIPPTEFFHKRPILLERGTFRALHQVFPGLRTASQKTLMSVEETGAKPTAHVLEISLNNILKAQLSTDEELLEVLTQLCKYHNNVLISSYSEFFHLTQYLRRYSQAAIGFIVSAALLPLLFEDDRYSLLNGGVLEASARLFQQKVHLLVYPVEHQLFNFYLDLVHFDTSKVKVTEESYAMARNITLTGVTNHLLRYLIESGIILDVPISD